MSDLVSEADAKGVSVFSRMLAGLRGEGGDNADADYAEQIERVRMSCPFTVATSAVVGGGMGALMGLFLSSMQAGSPELALHLGDRNPVTGELYATTTQQVRAVFRDMLRRTVASARSFAKIGAIFSGSECVIEGVFSLPFLILISWRVV